MILEFPATSCIRNRALIIAKPFERKTIVIPPSHNSFHQQVTAKHRTYLALAYHRKVGIPSHHPILCSHQQSTVSRPGAHLPNAATHLTQIQLLRPKTSQLPSPITSSACLYSKVFPKSNSIHARVWIEASESLAPASFSLRKRRCGYEALGVAVVLWEVGTRRRRVAQDGGRKEYRRHAIWVLDRWEWEERDEDLNDRCLGCARLHMRLRL